MGNEAATANVTPTALPNQGGGQAIPGTPSAPPKPGTEIHTDKPGGGQPPKVDDFSFEHKGKDGRVRKLSREEVRNRLLLAEGAYEKFETAAQKEKRVADWQAKAQKDFIEALQDPALGLTKDQIRHRFETWYRENFIDPETMTEEQREAARMKKENDAFKKKEEERLAKEKQDQETEAETQTRLQMEKQIIACIEQSGLPKTRFVAGRMAYWQKQNLLKGYDAPNEVIVQQVKDERQSIVRQDIEAMTPQQIVETFGEEIIKKLRQFDLARLNERFNPSAPKETVARKKETGEKKTTMADVDNYLNSLRRSKTARRE